MTTALYRQYLFQINMRKALNKANDLYFDTRAVVFGGKPGKCATWTSKVVQDAVQKCVLFLAERVRLKLGSMLSILYYFFNRYKNYYSYYNKKITDFPTGTTRARCTRGSSRRSSMIQPPRPKRAPSRSDAALPLRHPQKQEKAARGR